MSTLNTQLLYRQLKKRIPNLSQFGSFTVDVLNSFSSPYKILPISQGNKFLMIFPILSWNCMLCVLIRIASSRRF